MAQPFDAELEELVNKFSRDLAEQIRDLLLRRLGIERASTPKVPAKVSIPRSGPASSPLTLRSKRGGPRSSTRVPVSERRQTNRASAEEKNQTLDRIARFVGTGEGLSAGEIERGTGFSKAVVSAALKALKEQGRVFMGGTKRFARYAGTQAIADRASEQARTKTAA